MDGQFFNIRIKKEHVNIQKMRPPAFYLWAKDRDDLNQILTEKDISTNHIESITEKGADWDSIVK